MSDTWPCCISRTLPPPRWRNTRCGLPSTSSSNQTPFQGSLKVAACEVCSLIYVDQLECSKEYCNNAPVHLYQCLQSIGVVRQEVSLKRNFRVLFQRFGIAPSMPPQWQEGLSSMFIKQYPTVFLCLGKRWKHSKLQAWLQSSSFLIATLCLSSQPVRHQRPAWPDPCSSSFTGGWAGQHQNPITNTNPVPKAAAAAADPTGTVQLHPQPPSSSDSSQHTIHHWIRKLSACQWCN